MTSAKRVKRVRVLVEPGEMRRRRLLFRPCRTPEDFHDWLLAFLGLELPDCTVDPDSDSNPAALAWEVYELALRGGSEEISEIMGFASRDSYKTVLSAVLEIAMVFHHHRDVVHLAAIERQSLRAQKYVRKFLERPTLRDFMAGEDNKRTLGVIWYQREEEYLTAAEWGSLPPAERDTYQAHTYEIQVVVCTTSGVQGPHGEFMVVDEVDVIANPSAYQDAKMIPGERTDRRQLPITLKISTRKSAFGLVQQEINDAPRTRMQVRHWNILDVTEACPPARHRPDLPRLPIYVDPKELEALSEAKFALLPDDKKSPFQKLEGYGGCMTNCQMFAACRGHLATRQSSSAATLKSVSATQLAFKRLGGSPDVANAQLLSRKPSSEGLIYPRIDADVHALPAADILQKLTERAEPGATPDRLAQVMVGELGAEWFAGVDFGYTHNFSVTLALVAKPWVVIFDFFEAAGLELEQQKALCEERGLKAKGAKIYPDMAYPGSISSFARAGFNVIRWKKGPGTVPDGIQVVRGKLRPTMGEPEMLFVRESSGAIKLLEQLSKYHFTKDAQGNWTDIPDEEGDDGPDSARYLVMNVFPARGGTAPRVASGPTPTSAAEADLASPHQQWFHMMAAHAGRTDGGQPTIVRKGRMVMLS